VITSSLEALERHNSLIAANIGAKGPAIIESAQDTDMFASGNVQLVGQVWYECPDDDSNLDGRSRGRCHVIAGSLEGRRNEWYGGAGVIQCRRDANLSRARRNC